MGYRYKYEDGSILEFSQEPTLREIEQAGINAGIVKPSLKQKFDETLMGGFQSIAKMGTGILRSGVAISAALSPTKTLADYETATKKPGVLNSIAAPFIPGSQAAKDFNAQFITPKNTYQQRGQLAGDIGQFLVAAPVTGVSNLQRLAVAPLIDTAIQATQDVGAGTTDQKTLLTNAMLTAGTSIMAGVFMPTKKVNWLKLSASGALTGYVADVATGLTGARGEDRAGLNAFIPGAGTAFGTGMGVATGALTRFSPAGQRAKIVENRINALTQLEADHPKIRAAFDNAREQGYDPINILAHTDALNDSTTRGGKIDMGKALNKLDMEMEPMEPHVYNTLKQEGITITPRQFAKGLVDMLASSRLQLDERAVLQAKIKTLIKVANDVAKKNGGKIPLYMVQARKTSLGAQIRTQYGTVKGSTNKEIVRAYKEIVEKYTQSMDVKAYNQILQQLYTFRSVLSSLNGRVIEGGRLSRHVQTLLGSYIGGHVGGAPGAVLGYDLAYKARSGYNEKYFGQMETPTVKKGAYGIAKKATTRQESLGKQNQSQRNTATQSNAISESVPQKKGIVSRAKDAVKGAIKAYKDLPPSTKQGGFARISGEGESARGKAEQTIKGRQVSSGNDNTPEQKLTVNANSLNVNEKMQIIDETKTGADALVGMVGKDLSPALRKAVIEAVKAKDQATLDSLAPQIAEELNAKAQRQAQTTVSTLSPEEIEARRQAKLRQQAEQRRIVAGNSNQLSIGLSPVQGKMRLKWDNMYDEANRLIEAGDFAGANKIHAKIIQEGENVIRKRAKGSPFEDRLKFKGVGYGVFEKNPEPNIDFTIEIKPGEEDLAHRFVADLAQHDFVQKSVLTYKVLQGEEHALGVVDETRGISNEPMMMFFPDEPLSVQKFEQFRKILGDVGLYGMSVKDNGARIDILHLTAYDSAKDYAGFNQKLFALQKALHSKGFSGVSELKTSETRLTGDSRVSKNISYKRAEREFLKRNPSFIQGDETLGSKVLEQLRYKDSVSRDEFRELVRQLPAESAERKVYEDILKRIKSEARVNPRGLLRLLKNRALKVKAIYRPGQHSSYWERLKFNDEDVYKTHIAPLETNIPKEVDQSGVHRGFETKLPQFGHIQFAVSTKVPIPKKGKLREMKAVWVPEQQADNQQQSIKYKRITKELRGGGEESSKEDILSYIRRNKNNIESSKIRIKESQKEITQTKAGNDMNHRVVTEGQYVVDELNAWVRAQGLTTTPARNAQGVLTTGDRYVLISDIKPHQAPDGDGYNVELTWKEDGQERTHVKFIRAMFQGDTPIVSDRGLGQWLDINVRTNSSRESLQELVTKRRNNLAEDTQRFIADRKEKIETEKERIRENTDMLKKWERALKDFGKEAKFDPKIEQFLGFREDDRFAMRLQQETISAVIDYEKPEVIAIATPSTTARFENHLKEQQSLETAAPKYTYPDNRWGEGAPDLTVGKKINMMADGQPYDATIIETGTDAFYAVRTSDIKIKSFKGGSVSARNKIKDLYTEQIMKAVKSRLENYLGDEGNSGERAYPEVRAFSENLTLDTPLTEENLGRIYQLIFGAHSYPFSTRNRGYGSHTIRSVINKYLKRQNNLLKNNEILGVVSESFSDLFGPYGGIPAMAVNLEGKYYTFYIFPNQSISGRLKQPRHFKSPVFQTNKIENRLDTDRDFFLENVSSSYREQERHSFDNKQRNFELLEMQFKQNLVDFTDPKGNSWKLLFPNYNAPEWKNIKKLLF